MRRRPTWPRSSRPIRKAGEPLPPLDPSVLERIGLLCEGGRDLWDTFDADVRQDEWHPFVPADYDVVRDTLLLLRRPGTRFLEWGSATGIITIMADLMGFDASGIELDESLVRVARELAEQSGSGARFVSASFLPMGWAWTPPDGDGRTGTVGHGTSGYLELGHALEEYDVVYGYPWMGEEQMMHDLMQAHGRRDALLLIHTVENGVKIYRDGSLVPASDFVEA